MLSASHILLFLREYLNGIGPRPGKWFCEVAREITDIFQKSAPSPVRHCLDTYPERVLDTRAASAISEGSDPITRFVAKKRRPSMRFI